MAKRKRGGGRKPGEWTAVTPEQISQFRQDNEISRRRLAPAMGVSTTTIQNWETSNAVAMPRLQEKIAALISAGPSAVGAPSVAGHSGACDPSALLGPQVTAAATIVEGYLRTEGTKVSPEQLVELIRTVRGALV
jgi:DNA-binding XRE family transcriptional regulator